MKKNFITYATWIAKKLESLVITPDQPRCKCNKSSAKFTLQMTSATNHNQSLIAVVTEIIVFNHREIMLTVLNSYQLIKKIKTRIVKKYRITAYCHNWALYNWSFNANLDLVLICNRRRFSVHQWVKLRKNL